MRPIDTRTDLPARVRKFAETAEPHEVAEFLLTVLAESPEIARTRWGIEFIAKCKRDLKNKSFAPDRMDVEIETFRRRQAEFDDFRERVMHLLYSEKMALPEWLMDMNELVVKMNYTSDPEKKLVAIRKFEKQMYQEFKRFKKNPDAIRWRA